MLGLCSFAEFHPDRFSLNGDTAAPKVDSAGEAGPSSPHGGTSHPRSREGGPFRAHGPGALLRQQRAPYVRPANAQVVRAFADGKRQADDVLKATTASIARCGAKTEEALACFHALDGAVNRRTGERVRANVFVYNALISALERAGQPQLATRYLKRAVERGVFRRSLGYDRTDNTLNFHRNAVESGAASTTNGISSDVARSIFRRLFDRGIINMQTQFIVGHRSGHKIGDAIWDCMGDVGWPPRHPLNERGQRNEGRLAVDLMPQG